MSNLMNSILLVGGAVLLYQSYQRMQDQKDLKYEKVLKKPERDFYINLKAGRRDPALDKELEAYQANSVNVYNERTAGQDFLERFKFENTTHFQRNLDFTFFQ